MDWKTSRKFFYWRLRRNLLEDQAVKRIRSANESIQPGAAALAMLRRWFVESKGTVNVSQRIIHMVQFHCVTSDMFLSLNV